MWLEKSVMYPALHSTIRDVLESDIPTKVQFIMEPLAYPIVAALAKTHGARFIEQLSYLSRTFAFYMHREYQKLLESLKSIIYFSFGGHSTICSLNAVYIIGKENYSSVSDDCILYLVNKRSCFIPIFGKKNMDLAALNKKVV